MTRRGSKADGARADRFVGLAARHAGIVRKVAHLYAETADEREALAQEILLQAWRGFTGFREDASFATWLYRVALNVGLTYRRSAQRRPRADELSPLAAAAMAAEAPADPRVEALYAAIRRLPPVHRSLISLHLDGYSHREIGDLIGASEGAVATRLHRVRERLRAYLQPQTT